MASHPRGTSPQAVRTTRRLTSFRALRAARVYSASLGSGFNVFRLWRCGLLRALRCLSPWLSCRTPRSSKPSARDTAQPSLGSYHAESTQSRISPSPPATRVTHETPGQSCLAAAPGVTLGSAVAVSANVDARSVSTAVGTQRLNAHCVNAHCVNVNPGRGRLFSGCHAGPPACRSHAHPTKQPVRGGKPPGCTRSGISPSPSSNRIKHETPDQSCPDSSRDSVRRDVGEAASVFPKEGCTPWPYPIGVCAPNAQTFLCAAIAHTLAVMPDPPLTRGSRT